ncbi:MAG TPA: AMP-binding protein [Segetibacter sp.]|nr:AMP-binding protein [Segetibacter sp.]
MSYQSPLSMLYHWETAAPDKVYLRQPIDDVWNTWTWKQTADEVRRMAAGIKAMELPPKSNIALISKNCAHWIICDLAIMMSGHTSVPLYPNLNANSIREILEHSGAMLLFVGKLDDWHVIKQGVPDGLKCIAFPFCNYDEYESWENISNLQKPLNENIERDQNDIATIIYTSGTTGTPKGVMHQFQNFSFVAANAIPYLGFKSTDRFFSYLPLSHIAERLLVETISLYVGGEVSFAESLPKFPKNLSESKPTVFLGVPRVWTKVQQGILEKMPQKRLDMLLKVPLVSAIIKKKIKTKLGLADARIILTGAAPTPPALIKWFKTIGINIQEAYAMTENCCYSHVSLKNKIKIGFVGQPLPKCEVKLGTDNEILIKHVALMTGYYKEPEMSKEAFSIDGFLHTGDEGYIDKEGFLKITGRVKDLFKTTKAKYVAPSPIEIKIASNTDIEQVCVVGADLPQPIALIILSEAGKKKIKEELYTGLKEMMEQINASLDTHEELEKVVVLSDEWTVENGLLTPTFKIKRKEIEKKYSPRYEEWYSRQEMIVE